MSRWINYDAIDYRNDKLHDKSEEFLNGVIYMAQRIEEAPSFESCEDDFRLLLEELHDLADEFSEVDEYGLHSERWCGIMDAIGIVTKFTKAHEGGRR